jgi:hypothetical protein
LPAVPASLLPYKTKKAVRVEIRFFSYLKYFFKVNNLVSDDRFFKKSRC